MPTVSIIIPAYNEARFIGDLLTLILSIPTEQAGFRKEIVVVDDGSQDATAEVVRRFPVVLIQQPNQGKGSAVQRGIREATGDLVLIQDADLEYNPQDYLPMLAALRPGVDCVYGSRTLGAWREKKSLTPGRHPQQAIGPWLAGVFLTLWTFLLYGRWITDTLTGYKIYPRGLFSRIRVETKGFETDHEITAKLLRLGFSIREVPITYKPRSLTEGKKIRARDGFIAIWTLLKYRF